MTNGGCVPRFLSSLNTRELDENANQGRGLFELLIALGFLSIRFGRTFWAPAGTKTDFASIPRLPLIWLFLGDRYRAPAALHDYLYGSHEVPRRAADALLLEMCTAVDAQIVYRWRLTRAIGKHTTWLRRHSIWFGVRLFGWSHW
ncbi:MAG: DUF1353 domain-containing protein [Candidimonas sp.]|nr:MAG: DUF1353 domain-containing protein [Candidimonas sp.]TAM80765.1 MAG: DUF1353 domain-containing protein [Candidimonas sp.]